MPKGIGKGSYSAERKGSSGNKVGFQSPKSGDYKGGAVGSGSMAGGLGSGSKGGGQDTPSKG